MGREGNIEWEISKRKRIRARAREREGTDN